MLEVGLSVEWNEPTIKNLVNPKENKDTAGVVDLLQYLVDSFVA